MNSLKEAIDLLRKHGKFVDADAEKNRMYTRVETVWLMRKFAEEQMALATQPLTDTLTQINRLLGGTGDAPDLASDTRALAWCAQQELKAAKQVVEDYPSISTTVELEEKSSPALDPITLADLERRVTELETRRF